jgi:hypothetical protein
MPILCPGMARHYSPWPVYLLVPYLDAVLPQLLSQNLCPLACPSCSPGQETWPGGQGAAGVWGRGCQQLQLPVVHRGGVHLARPGDPSLPLTLCRVHLAPGRSCSSRHQAIAHTRLPDLSRGFLSATQLPVFSRKRGNRVTRF